ncbi:MAG: PQQ-binding-like beta-propeller repeat protein [Bacteroidales bacterium]
MRNLLSPLFKFIALLSIIALFCFTWSCQSGSRGENWTHFRGSNLDGISLDKSAPLTWTETENITWKSAMEGRGWSSPVVYRDQIWYTTATRDGKEMFAVCTDFNTGQNLFNINVFQPDTIYRKHAINSYATPTPCIEKDYVYVHYGRYGTACLSTETGIVIWSRTDLQCEHIQGPASSPILYKDMLILHLEGTDVQYIIALDKSSGETVWKTDRPKECYDPLEWIGKKAYTTPLVVEVNGKDLLISNGAAVCIAYDPETGKEIWRIVQGEDSTIAMPSEEDGIIYFYTSFVTPPGGDQYAELLAVDPDGKGDIAASNILWRVRFPVLQLLTPLVKDGLIYTVDSKGILLCMDTKTGETVWSEKLKEKYHSSPVYIAGHIYFNSNRGETLVIKEGRELEIVARNQLDGEIWATPAVVDGAILMRTSKYLYKIRQAF